MSCYSCLFYNKKEDFCKWTMRNLSKYVDVNNYSCIGFVNKKYPFIRGSLYNE